MSFEDERIVKMTFDNKAFQKNIESTIRALERLDKSMKLEDVSPKAFDNFVEGVEETDQAMSMLDATTNKVKASFTLLQIAGYTAMAELTKYAINTGKKIYANTLGQIKSGGLARALNIEAAKFQIEGLGHAWNDVSEDIDYAVKGTAYGMDSAAKAASQLLASQIETGDQMKVALRGISGLAAMTNSSYDDIADIFTTVAGNGRLMGDQLNRISYRGINAAQTLLDYYKNVKNLAVNTEAEIRDLVSKGKVSFMDFAAAMDYAFGEHAKDANKTFTGAISNMKAALSRIGERFLSPWNEFERKLAVAVIPVIDRVKKAMDLVMPVYNNILDNVSAWVEKLADSYYFQKSILNVVIGIWSWIQNILGALRELGFQLPAIEDFVGLLDLITSKLVLNAEQGRHVREVVKVIVKALSILVTILQGILYVLEPIYKPILSFLKNVNIYNKGVIDKSATIIDKINYIIKVVAILLHLGVEKSIKLIIGAIKLLIAIVEAAGFVIAGIILVISKVVKAVKIMAEAISKYGKDVWDVIKAIGDGFVKFYDTVREIFKNIGDGMDGFLENAKSKTSELWDTINNMVGTKKLNIDVGITTKATPLTPQSMVPKNAVSNVNALTDSTKNYSSAAQEAEKAGKKAAGAASLGKYGSGYMTNMFNGTDIIKAKLQGLGDGADRMSRDIENSADRTTRAVDKMARDVNDSSDKIWLFNNTGTFGEKAEGLYDTFISKLEVAKSKLDKAKDRIVEHFTNFFAVLTDTLIISTAAFTVASIVVIVKVVKAIFGALNILPELMSSLSNAAKGFKYAGMADAFKGLALALLAFGALLATIAIITKFVDFEDFKKFSKIVALLIVACSLLAFAVSHIVMAIAALRLINNLAGLKPFTTKITNFISSMRDMFIGLAILMTTIIAGVVVIEELARHNGGYDEINQAAKIIAGLILATGAFMIIVTKVIGGSAGVTSKMNIGLNGWTRTVSSQMDGVISMIRTMIPLIAVLVGSVYLLSRPEADLTKAGIAFGMIMTTFIVTFGGIIGLCVYLNERVGGISDVDKIARSGALKEVIGSISILVNSLSLFMASFVASAMVLSLIPKSKQDFAFKMMTTQFIAIGLIIGGICATISILNAYIQKSESGLAKVTAMSKTMAGLAAVISAIGASILSVTLSVAGALAIISIIPAGKLWSSVGAFSIVITVVSGVIFSMIMAMKSFSQITAAGNVLGGKSRGLMEGVGQQVALTIAALSTMMLTISTALAMLSLVDSNKMMKATGMLSIMAVVMTAMLSAILVLLKSTSTFTALGSGVTGFMDNTGMMMVQILTGMSMLMLSIATALYILGRMNPDALTRGLTAMTAIFAEVSLSIIGLLLVIAMINNSFKGLKMTKNRLGFINEMVGLISVLSGAMALLIGAMISMVLIFDQSKSSSIAFAMGVMAESFLLMMVSIMGVLAVISVISKDKIKMNPATLTQISIMIGVLAAAMSAMMLSFGVLAKVLSTADTGIVPAFIALASIVAALGVSMAIITGFAPQIIKATPAIYAMIPVAASLSGLMITFAAMAYILGMTNWDNITANIETFMKVILGVGFLMVVVGAVSLVGSKAIKPMIALALAVSVLVGVVAYSITKIIESYKNIVDAFNILDEVAWGKLQTNTQSLTAIITAIKDAVKGGAGVGLNAILLGVGVKALAEGLKILTDLDTFKLSGAAGALKNAGEGLKDATLGIVISLGALALIGSLMGIVGPLVLAGILTLVASFMILFASIPLIMSLIVKAVDSIANTCETIKTGINTIKKEFGGNFGDSVKEACASLIPLLDLGMLMFFAGVLLAIGTGAFLVGAVLLLPAIAMLDYSISNIGTEMNEKLMYAVAAMGGVMLLSIGMILAAALLGIGASLMLGAVAGLLVTVALLCLAMAQSDFIKENALSFVEVIFIMAGIALAIIDCALVFLVAAAVVGIASMALMPALLLLAGTLGLIYLCSLMDMDTMLDGIKKMAIVVLTLGGLAVAMTLIAVPLMLGTLGLMIACVFLATAGVSIAIAAVSFALGMLALWGALLIIQQMDFEGLNEKILPMLGFVGLIAGIGIGFIVIGAILVIAGALLSVGSILLSIAIVTLAISLTIGAALLLVSAYLLEMAFTQLQVAFAAIGDWGEIIENGLKLIVFGALLAVGGLLLLVGSGLMLPGAIILLIAGTMLSAAMLVLKKGFNSGLKGTEFVKQAALYLASAGMLSIAAPLLVGAGAMILSFANTFSTAAKLLVTSVNSLKDASGFLGDIVDSFEDAGANIVDGITTGIADKASECVDSIKDTATDILDGFCDVLGIHSPAEEFIEKASMCIAGIVEGFGGDKDKAYNAVKSVGMGMLDTFSGLGDGFASVGSSLGDIFTGSMGDKIKELMPDLANGVLGDFNDLLNGMQTAALDKQLAEATAKYNEYYGLAYGSGDEMGKYYGEQADFYYKEMERIKKEKAAYAVTDYTQEVMNQMGDWSVGGGGASDIDYAMLDSATSDALSGVNTGKAGADASRVGGNVSTAITNNTYNFTQNNFSPEPIDRTEIYTQTNNQLDTWYKWIRDNS